MNSVRRRNRSQWPMVLVLVAAGFSGAAAQQSTTAIPATNAATHAPDESVPPGFQERYPRYRMQAGDTFDLSFEFSPEFNQSLTVQPDGFVTLREVGDVYVSGLTFPEASRAIADKYSTILKQPKISVMPKDIQKRYFIAAGEVSKPGKYELRGETTVAQAIAMAGGLVPDRAKHSEVVVFRRTGDTLAFGRLVDLKKMYQQKDLREDLILKPGDLIYVPQNRWSKVKQFVPIPGVGLSMMPGLP